MEASVALHLYCVLVFPEAVDSQLHLGSRKTGSLVFCSIFIVKEGIRVEWSGVFLLVGSCWSLTIVLML